MSAVGDGVHVAISVADEGRGIPPERLPHLFRKFSTEQSGEREGDTGLGLAICKGIVEAHGGRIWAESDGPGTGARFTFTLPSVEEPAAGGLPARSTRREQQGEEGQRLRILAVDDDPNDLRYVRDTLAKSGYDPILTGEPTDVVRLVEEERPELVLLDLMLPGDGRHRADEGDPRRGRRAGHLPLRLWARGADRQSLRHGGRRLRRQALLGDGACGEDPGGPAPASDRGADGALRAGRPDHRLRRAPGDAGGGAAAPDRDGVRAARRALGERRAGADLPAPAGTGLGVEKSDGDVRPMRTIVSKLRRKLGEDTEHPRFVFTEPRVGFRMPRGTARE